MKTLTAALAVAGLLVLAGPASAQSYAWPGRPDPRPAVTPYRGGVSTYYSPVQNFYEGGAPVAVVRPGGYPVVGTPAFGYPGLGYPGRAPRATYYGR